jgi:hypothetical protein
MLIWFVFWIAIAASGVTLDGLAWWGVLLVPNVILGAAVARWWAVLLPFGLIVLLPIVPTTPCPGQSCGEGDIPAWVLILGDFAPRAAAATALGVAIRRSLSYWSARRRQRATGFS